MRYVKAGVARFSTGIRSHLKVLSLAFLLFIICPPLIASDFYLLEFLEQGKLTKAFAATLHATTEAIEIRSEVASDCRLERAQKSEAFSDGEDSYVLSYENQNSTIRRVSGTLREEGERLYFTGSYGPDIRLFPIGIIPRVETTLFYLPYKDPDRRSIAYLRSRVIGRYGDARSSVKRGHKHAGVDLKGSFEEKIYPIGKGVVLFVSDKAHNSTVIIRHDLPRKPSIYSKYVHLKDTGVSVGQVVDESIAIGRLFNKGELKASGYKTTHLHLEIRRNYEDKGKASSYSMSMKELGRHCFDPLAFFEEHL